MKKIFIFSIMCLFAVCFCSCDSDNVDEPEQHPEQEAEAESLLKSLNGTFYFFDKYLVCMNYALELNINESEIERPWTYGYDEPGAEVKNCGKLINTSTNDTLYVINCFVTEPRYSNKLSKPVCNLCLETAKDLRQYDWDYDPAEVDFIQFEILKTDYFYCDKNLKMTIFVPSDPRSVFTCFYVVSNLKNYSLDVQNYGDLIIFYPNKSLYESN